MFAKLGANLNEKTGLLTAAAVGVGVLLRLRQYLTNPSVWTDEANLLVNVVHAPPMRLVTGPLNYVPALVGHPNATQAAPPLWLLGMKGMVTLWPQSELAARFIPLASSLLALVLFAFLARRVLSPLAALAAVLMLAFAEPLILHAANAKQYSSDALATVIILLLAVVPRRASPMRRLVFCAAAATVLLWFSHPSVFAYAAASVALLYQSLRGDARPDEPAVEPSPAGARPSTGRLLLTWVAVNIVPGVSFLLLYYFSVRTQTDPFLRTYWAEGFADYSRPASIPRWLVTQLIEASSYPPTAVTWLLPALMLVAVIFAWRGTARSGTGSGTADVRATRFHVLLAVGPLAFLVLAAFARQYPLVGKRLCAFLLPATVLGAALGADLLAAAAARAAAAPEGRARLWPRVAAAALGVVLVASAVRAADIALHPRNQGDVRACARYVMSRRAPGEPVYVWGGKASCVFFFYEPRRDDPTIHLTADHTRPPEGESFWVIAQLGRWGTTTAARGENFAERLDELRREMVQTDELKADRAGAYRFTRRPSAVAGQ